MGEPALLLLLLLLLLLQTQIALYNWLCLSETA